MGFLKTLGLTEFNELYAVDVLILALYRFHQQKKKVLSGFGSILICEVNLVFHMQQYGDIHTLYTACKHRGFVMISYYDIRTARTAMKALQNKALRRRKLDIHYSIPKVSCYLVGYQFLISVFYVIMCIT